MSTDKWLIVGDCHCRYNRVECRVDNTWETLKKKFQQIKKIYQDSACTALIFLGDFFDSTVIGNFELMYPDLLELLPENCYTLVGNHDFTGKKVESLEDLKKTSLYILLSKGLLNVASLELKKEGIKFYDYANKDMFYEDQKDKSLRVAFIHDYVVPSSTSLPFKHTKIEDLENSFERVVFCGHYHSPCDVKVGNTRYINPGALFRSTRAKEDVERKPEVILFEPETLDVRHIPLKVEENPFILEDKEELQNFNFIESLSKASFSSGSKKDFLQSLKDLGARKEVLDYTEKVWDEVNKK